MKTSRLLVVAALLTGCSSEPGSVEVGEISGLWQFPNRGVWVQIDNDGSAFQCRVAQDDNLIVSKGRFAEPDSIVWEQEWGTDLVHVVAEGIVLDGKYGKFTFAKAADPMTSSCAAALAAP